MNDAYTETTFDTLYCENCNAILSGKEYRFACGEILCRSCYDRRYGHTVRTHQNAGEDAISWAEERRRK